MKEKADTPEKKKRHQDGIRGLTQAEIATLRALEAVEDEASTRPEQAAKL